MNDSINNKHPLDIINILKRDSGKIYKQEQLKKFKDNMNWLKVLTYTYDPKFTYGIRQLRHTLEDIQGRGFGYPKLSMPLDLIFANLDSLARREVTGKRAIELVESVMDNTYDENAELMYWILKRDLKCGIDAKSIIRAYGNGVVHKPPYMGAVNYDPKKVKALFNRGDGYVYAENKADGQYGALVVNKDTGKHYIESRAGHIIYGMDKLIEDALNDDTQSNFVIQGEIMVRGFDRMTANGIVNAIKGIHKKKFDGKDPTKDIKKFQESVGITIEEAQNRLYMQCWDVITLNEYNDRYSPAVRGVRLRNLKNMVKSFKRIEVVDYIVTKDYDEVMDFFSKQLANDLEGLVVKSSDGVWKDGKPVTQIKLKLEFVSDLKVVGFNEGKVDTRFEGSLGSLICESENGLLKTDVSGMDDNQRFHIWNNKDEYLNRIVEVKCNGLSKSSDNEHFSMMYANVYKKNKEIQWRTDKYDANTLEEIQQIENSKKYGE